MAGCSGSTSDSCGRIDGVADRWLNSRVALVCDGCTACSRRTIPSRTSSFPTFSTTPATAPTRPKASMPHRRAAPGGGVSAGYLTGPRKVIHLMCQRPRGRPRRRVLGWPDRSRPAIRRSGGLPCGKCFGRPTLSLVLDSHGGKLLNRRYTHPPACRTVSPLGGEHKIEGLFQINSRADIYGRVRMVAVHVSYVGTTRNGHEFATLLKED